MTTTESNIILARYLGWQESSIMHKGKKLITFKGPNDTDFSADLQFDKDWNWFQLAFQKARKDKTLSVMQTEVILGKFETNHLDIAGKAFAVFIEINLTNQTAPSVSGE